MHPTNRITNLSVHSLKSIARWLYIGHGFIQVKLGPPCALCYYHESEIEGAFVLEKKVYLLFDIIRKMSAKTRCAFD